MCGETSIFSSSLLSHPVAGLDASLVLGAMTPLILKRASASRSSGQWRDDDYDVLENGVVVGRIFFLGAVAPPDRPWMWASGHNGEMLTYLHTAPEDLRSRGGL
jgi:hypothetical protein